MAKRIVSLLVALLALCTLPLAAHAQDIPQVRDDCTFELLVQYKDVPIDSGDLTAILVGYLDEDDGDYFFRQVFTGERLDSAYVQATDTPKKMLEFYNANKDKFDFSRKNIPIKKGVGKFENMSTGLYLIIQEKACSGYSKLNPFLVSAPYLQDGEYRYSLTAKIKTELEQEPEPTKPSQTPPSKLPQTGQLNWPVPVMVVCGLLLFFCGWVIRFSDKRESDA